MTVACAAHGQGGRRVVRRCRAGVVGRRLRVGDKSILDAGREPIDTTPQTDPETGETIR